MSDAEAPGPSEEPLPQGARHPLGIGSKFSVSADGQELSIVAESAQQRGEWVSALRVVSEKAATSRAELSMTSKLTYDARRRMEIENKRRDAERRKAEIMKNGGMVGMKHTARAMASR